MGRQTHKQTKTDTLSHIEPGRIRRKAREDLALIGNSIRRHIHVDLEMFIARKFTSNSVPLQLLHLRSAEKVTNYKIFFLFLKVSVAKLEERWACIESGINLKLDFITPSKYHGGVIFSLQLVSVYVCVSVCPSVNKMPI